MINRRSVLLGTVAAAAASRRTFANTAWPNRPIRIVVPFPAGGPTDFIVRLMGNPLQEILGRPIVIDNRPGASGNLGTQSVVDSDPDGHTLVHNTVGVQAINPLMLPDSRLRPERDLIGVATTATMPNVLVVHPRKLPISTLKELVEFGKQQPNRLSCATFGPGTSAHIYGSLLQKVGGFQAVDVPYRGSALALNDVLAGQVDYLFDSMTTSVNHVKEGTLRGLAITSNTRSALLPDVPTMSEAGYPAFDLKFWFALYAPAKTPPEIVAKLQDAIGRVLSDPGFVASLRSRGAEPLITPAVDLAAFLRNDGERWAAVAREIGVKPPA